MEVDKTANQEKTTPVESIDASKTEHSKKGLNKGARNLIILGIASTVIALITTGISLLIYHNSGDIYLDRSRPGFMPDEEEVADNEDEEEYDFSKSGPINLTVLEEYLNKLKVETDAIDAYEKPFDSNILSDKELGIPEETEEEIE